MTGTALALVEKMGHMVDTRKTDIVSHLGSIEKYERFRTTFLEAVRREAKIAQCDPASTLDAVMRAANDRLPVDGRYSAIVPFLSLIHI
jgi:recombinational DNA repair protein RecT